MNRIIVLIFCLLSFCANAQDLSQIKHLEVVSEIQDSMVLLNRTDVNKINKVFFEKEKLDSIKSLNEETISLMEIKNTTLDSIITHQQIIIHNDQLVLSEMNQKLEDQKNYYQKRERKERTQKIC
jgi:hypothetical protein